MEPRGNTLTYVLGCMTKEDARVPNKPCVFPWKFNSKNSPTYEGCANPDDDDGLWCPTATNDDGVYIAGSGTWGFCRMDNEGGGCQYSGMCGILYPLITPD